MVNGKIIYPSGDPAQVSYTFPQNFDFGHTPDGRIQIGSIERSFDKTALYYAESIKKKFELSFTRVTKAQKDYFMMLYSFQCPMDLYIDGVNLDAVVLMTEPPDPQSEAAFDTTGQETYSFSVLMEEV